MFTVSSGWRMVLRMQSFEKVRFAPSLGRPVNWDVTETDLIPTSC